MSRVAGAEGAESTAARNACCCSWVVMRSPERGWAFSPPSRTGTHQEIHKEKGHRQRISERWPWSVESRLFSGDVPPAHRGVIPSRTVASWVRLRDPIGLFLMLGIFCAYSLAGARSVV